MTHAMQQTDDSVLELFQSRMTNGYIRREDIRQELANSGILRDDPRVKLLYHALDLCEERISEESFHELVAYAPTLIEQIFRGSLIVPDFPSFCSKLRTFFHDTAAQKQGSVATYIPQLARVDPDKFAVAVCTIDGQRVALGDADDFFCVQSCSKPLTYLLALEELGDEVHKFVGREPSGKTFNELTLNAKGLPHNPMINAGAIMCCALIKQGRDPADKFDHILQRWREAAAGMRVGFNNAVYLSERQTADRNFALGYFMREKNAFPEKVDLLQTLEFYFQCCSIELTAASLATVASTLANGGMCPLTGQQVFQPDYVKNCLSLMSSCGMYDFSGEFAFRVGLPAKSGVSGVVMVVIPNVMGLCIWSPRLDELGNSVRGVEFCKRLVDNFSFHTFDRVNGLQRSKLDATKSLSEQERAWKISFIWSAAVGDIPEMRRLIARGTNPSSPDYDGRTALHVAASEGKAAAVEFLLERDIDLSPVDRWHHTPLDDAIRHEHVDVQALLLQAGAKTHSQLQEEAVQ